MIKFLKKLNQEGKDFLEYLRENATPYIEKLKKENQQIVTESTEKSSDQKAA